MNRYLKIALVIALWATLAFPAPVSAANSADIIKEALSTITTGYYKSPNTDKLVEGAIRGMVASLEDPYSDYFTESEWNQFESYLDNEFVGVGIQIDEDESGIYIYKVFESSPADRAGIQVNDYVLAIDGKSVKGMDDLEFYEAISGEVATTIKLKLSRDGKPFTLSLKRAFIRYKSVVSRMYPGGIGYIEINSFSEDTAKDFVKQVNVLRSQGIKALMIDLRDNSGGYLDTAQEIGRYFIPNKALIREVDRSGKWQTVYVPSNAGSSTQVIDVPISILINEDSASASEAFAGALQDYKLAKLIGTKSYGKGTVQQIFQLSNRGVLKMTVREYLTPNGRRVDKKGITPDVKVEYAPAQLLRALQLAGQKKYALQIDAQQRLQVSGVVTGYRIEMIRAETDVYLPVKLLAELLPGSKVTTSTAGSVIVSYAGSSKRFDAKTGLKSSNGSTFISAQTFVKRFPNLKYNGSTKNVIISN